MGVYLSKVPFLIRIFFLIDLVLSISYLINISIGKPYRKLNLLLNLDGESSLATWFSSVQLFSIFILGSIFAFYKSNSNRKSLLLIGFPVIFLMMSIDEITQIHEWLGAMSDVLLAGDRSNTAFKVTGIWMFVIGLPFLAVFLIWFNAIKDCFDNKSSYKKILFGMMLLLIGALGIEIFSNFFTVGRHAIQVSLEESLEMIGASIMLWGFYELAADYLP